MAGPHSPCGGAGRPAGRDRRLADRVHFLSARSGRFDARLPARTGYVASTHLYSDGQRRAESRRRPVRHHGSRYLDIFSCPGFTVSGRGRLEGNAMELRNVGTRSDGRRGIAAFWAYVERGEGVGLRRPKGYGTGTTPGPLALP